MKKPKADNNIQNSTSEIQVGDDGKPITGIRLNAIYLGIGLVLLILGLGLTFVVGNVLFVLMAIVGLVLVSLGMV